MCFHEEKTRHACGFMRNYNKCMQAKAHLVQEMPWNCPPISCFMRKKTHITCGSGIIVNACK